MDPVLGAETSSEVSVMPLLEECMCGVLWRHFCSIHPMAHPQLRDCGARWTILQCQEQVKDSASRRHEQAVMRAML